MKKQTKYLLISVLGSYSCGGSHDDEAYFYEPYESEEVDTTNSKNIPYALPPASDQTTSSTQMSSPVSICANDCPKELKDSIESHRVFELSTECHPKKAIFQPFDTHYIAYYLGNCEHSDQLMAEVISKSGAKLLGPILLSEQCAESFYDVKDFTISWSEETTSASYICEATSTQSHHSTRRLHSVFMTQNLDFIGFNTVETSSLGLCSSWNDKARLFGVNIGNEFYRYDERGTLIGGGTLLDKYTSNNYTRSLESYSGRWYLLVSDVISVIDHEGSLKITTGYLDDNAYYRMMDENLFFLITHNLKRRAYERTNTMPRTAFYNVQQPHGEDPMYHNAQSNPSFEPQIISKKGVPVGKDHWALLVGGYMNKWGLVVLKKEFQATLKIHAPIEYTSSSYNPTYPQLFYDQDRFFVQYLDNEKIVLIGTEPWSP